MSANTPGPWHCGGIFWPNSDRPSVNVWGPTPPGKQSGSIVCCNATIPDGRLIAAAPELSEALQLLIALPLTYDGPFIKIETGSHGEAMETVRKARAALAKAGL